MTDIGQPFDPDDDCIGNPTKESCKQNRYEKQMTDNTQVIEEAVSVIEEATRKIAKASKELRKYGDAPFGDLERT